MAFANKLKVAALTVAATACACAQTLTWDFESDPFRGWTQTGQAFAGQPFCKHAQDAEMPSERFADGRLGGDYWKGLQYPLGQHGNCVVTSLLKVATAEPWSLTSPEFPLPPDALFLTFLIGGTNDAAHEGIELQVRRDGTWETAYSATGSGAEHLRQEIVETAPRDRGLPSSHPHF
jgi:hypothetical protein